MIPNFSSQKWISLEISSFPIYTKGIKQWTSLFCVWVKWSDFCTFPACFQGSVITGCLCLFCCWPFLFFFFCSLNIRGLFSLCCWLFTCDTDLLPFVLGVDFWNFFCFFFFCQKLDAEWFMKKRTRVRTRTVIQTSGLNGRDNSVPFL